MAQSAFSFPGAVTLTKTTLEDGNGTNVRTQTDTIPNIEAYSHTIDRTTSTAVSINYYIMVDYDLNPLVDVVPSSSIDEQDDTWFFGTGADKTGDLVISSTDDPAPTNVVRYLPTIVNKDVVVKRISVAAQAGGTGNGYLPLKYTWYDADGSIGDLQTVNTAGVVANLTDIFEVYVRFNSSTAGIINAETDVRNRAGAGGPNNDRDFTDFKITLDEDLTKAQKIGLGFLDLTFTDADTETADILSVTVDASVLRAQPTLTTKMNAINTLYDGEDLLASWSFTFNAQSKTDVDAVNNAISQHARAKGWTQGGTYFVNGNKIATLNGQILTVSVNDVDGNPVTLLENTNTNTVYGIINHADP